MLSDNIKNFRKKNNMSQDELAEKLGVSRQSVSLWETGQTQPTIDNIIALAKIFNVSSDVLLGNSDSINVSQDKMPGDKKPKKRKTGLILAIVLAAAVIIYAVILAVFLNGNHSETSGDDNSGSSTVENETTGDDNSGSSTVENETSGDDNSGGSTVEDEISSPVDVQFDLFSYCKNFAIKKGTLHGDYCIYQQPATKYGGYDDEYFSISYWGDSDMVEFCLHCPLSETQSINFYLRMRGGYYKKYEYASSKYFRDTGESFRFATGYIDPAVFSDSYPLSCDIYEGDVDGQTDFMEESRIGICDLINCLKEFVKVEKMECAFSNFEFVNF